MTKVQVSRANEVEKVEDVEGVEKS